MWRRLSSGDDRSRAEGAHEGEAEDAVRVPLSDCGCEWPAARNTLNDELFDTKEIEQSHNILDCSVNAIRTFARRAETRR